MAPAARAALLGAAREPCRETTPQSEGDSVQICSIVVIFVTICCFLVISHTTNPPADFGFANNTRTIIACLGPLSSAAVACLLSG